MIQDIQKGNRNNQILSASKVCKSDILKPSLQAELYLNGLHTLNEPQETHNDEEIVAIPEVNEKVKVIKLGPLRFKKNRITKSLNKLQMQANLRNSDT